MKRFLKKLSLFIGVPLIIFVLLQHFSDRGLRKSCSFLYKEWNDIVDGKINSNLIVMGSSRAWVHFSPAVLDSAFKTSCYNLGIDGYNFLMEYSRFNLFLKYNKKPSHVIQVLECQTLAKRTTLLDYQQFFPYLNEAIIQEAVSHYKGLDFKDLYFPMYKYRGDMGVFVQGLKTNFKRESNCADKYKGFKSFNKEWDNEFEEFKAKNPMGVREKLDTMTVRLFDEYLNSCKKENINMILVYAPEYKEAHKFILNRDSIINIYSELSKKYNVPFIDYSHDSICNSKTYFYNSQHLNTIGVALFNQKLVKDLKRIIN